MYAIQMMTSILSDGASSRINKSVVEKQQLAQFAFAFNYGLEDAGLSLMAAIAQKDVSLDAILKAFDVEIEKIQTELVTVDEFQKVRNQYENDFVSSNASVAGIAENLANNYVYMGDAGLINNELERYMSVTREDIQRVAKKYLTADARIIMHYLPKEEEDNTDK
jgi:predicted Zn-dependent peptidase